MGFYVFSTFIPYYGLCILIGIVCAFFMCYFLCKKEKLDTDDLIIICAYLIAFGFLGAKILYILVSLKSIDFKFVFKSMKTFNLFISSGFVFYGGLIGGFFSLLFVKRIHKINVNNYISILVPGVCIAHGFGRIGCSLAGCCHGKITQNNHFYFMYKKSIAAPNNVKLFPVQGIEAFCIILLGMVCFAFVLKRKKINVTSLYIFVYSILRFILEFFRGDTERGFIFFLSTSQIISIAGVFFGLASLLLSKNKKKQPCCFLDNQ